jgi:RHS repeat-associated protein
MNVDIYELVPAVSGTAVDIVHSYHTAVDITPVQPLREFIHVVIQGNDLTAHNLQVFVNGVACANAPNAPVSICGWQIGFNGQVLQYPENYAAVQHIRLYNGPLPQSDIAKLASNTCMANVGLGGNVARTGWYRFNVQAGSTGSGLEASPVYPLHTMTTSYAYNTLGQVVQQKTPDAGISKFWYDYLGRLILSQNAEQLAPAEAGAASNRFSYTTYDQLGRITEVGEALNLAAIPQKPFLQQAEYNTVMANTTRQQITRTYYDARQPWITQTLDNLRKRVVATVYEETAGTPQQSTYYSYDQLGNVKSLWQSISGLPTKQIEYNYDLASGKVNAVRYQGSGMEKFMYKYKYDAENRLVEVSNGYGTTGEDNWEIEYGKRQAVYQYYPHGPLSRIELGELNIQGIDYAYTLQGWLKGINGQFLDPSKDMGGDGSTRPTFAKDVMAYSLNYFPGDYQQVGTGVNTFALQFDPNGNFDGKPLYNGNISAITTALNQFRSGAPVGYSYTYDQLNRLVQMRQQDLASNATTWQPRAPGNIPYKEDITYDGNGNILTYKRNGSRTDVDDVMDNLAYTYGNGTNRLLSVQDASTNTSYSTDFKGTNGYTYDKIGNLMSETPNGASSIKWTVYGKIRSIVPTGGGSLSYRYDAGGNRVYKLYNKPGGGTVETWYVRDAQGNPLATYTKENGTTEWSEQHLYGSSRLGLWKPGLNVTASVEEAETKWLAEGGKRYELTNHLGNVMAVLSDKRLGGPVYTAEVVGMQDYYPFGMLMVGRSLGAGGYRYGFNGKENDNEVKGEGNQQDYGMRIYDTRLGRFLSLDPLMKAYPELTPYQFASNRPIDGVDLDGAEFIESFKVQQARARMHLQVKREIDMRPPEPEIWAADIYGNGHAGKESYVRQKLAIIREEHSERVAASIASGPFGAAGYMINGDEGAIKWSAVDQVAMSFGGIPAKNSRVFPKPASIEPGRFTPLIEAKGPGSLSIDWGGKYSQSEINAAKYMAGLGNTVLLRPPTGTRADGGTSDLLVNGVNYDVYTPISKNPNNIISQMAKKNSQTTGIVLDLSRTSVTADQLGNVLKRVQGAGAKNIKDIVIMPNNAKD